MGSGSTTSLMFLFYVVYYLGAEDAADVMSRPRGVPKRRKKRSGSWRTRISVRYTGFILAPAEGLWPSATYGAIWPLGVGDKNYYEGEEGKCQQKLLKRRGRRRRKMLFNIFFSGRNDTVSVQSQPKRMAASAQVKNTIYEFLTYTIFYKKYI